jgi:hypothetical protein
MKISRGNLGRAKGIKKNPAQRRGFKTDVFGAAFYLPRVLFAPGPLGSLDGVDLGLLLGRIGLDVGCQIANPVSPFQGRFRRGTAIGSTVVGHDAVAAIALFNDGMAASPAKSAALFFHERAFVTLSNGCADH